MMSQAFCPAVAVPDGVDLAFISLIYVQGGVLGQHSIYDLVVVVGVVTVVVIIVYSESSRISRPFEDPTTTTI
jgi:hypothetical protein